MRANYRYKQKSEYDRLKHEKSSLEAKINLWKAELSNTARTYQQFVDRNIELNKREDELQLSINELEAKESELQKTISRLEQHPSVLENNVNTNNPNPEVN